MSLVPALLVKVTLVLAVGLLVVAMMRSFTPSARHLVLLGCLGASLVLPIAMLVSPQWKVAILDSSAVTDAEAFAPAAPPDKLVTAYLAAPSPLSGNESTKAVGALAGGVDAVRSPSASAGLLDAAALVPLIWLIGFVLVVAWLVVGRLRLDHIARTAWPLADADWRRILDEELKAAGISKGVGLFSSPAVSTPLTWGWRSPVVMVPEDAIDWPEDHRRIVLRHELAHVARADSLAQLLAGITCGLYWFHPLAWVVERRLRAECERACDDTVVSSGTPAAEYAAHLLEVARSARAFGASGFLSVAMARPSQLEGRLLAVLNESRRRVSLSSRARFIGAAVTALLLVPLAAFRAVPREQAPAAASSPTAQSRPAPAPQAVETSTPADTTFELSAPASNGGTLVLDLNTGGKVIINSWDRPQVHVRASLGGRDWRSTKVTLSPSGASTRLESLYTGKSNNQSFSNVFEITVPRKYDVRISSAGGSISISGLNGTFSGNTGGGEITVANSSGEAHLRTGGGEIHVVGSRLDGSVSTGGGVVRIEGVTGNLEGYSGGGPVVVSKKGGTTITRSNGVNIVGVNADDGIHAGSGSGSGSGASSSSSGDGSTTTYVKGGSGYSTSYGSDGIRISSAGGALSLPSAPEGAHVTTGGGSIHIGPSGGEVYASTGGGAIDIGPASGSIEAHTGAGPVSIELQGASGHAVDATTGKGQIMLVVPRNLNAVLELESAYTNNLGHKTRIVSDIPVQTTETANWDDSEGTPRRYIRVRQTIGAGGPVIRVRAVNGDVVLRQK